MFCKQQSLINKLLRYFLAILWYVSSSAFAETPSEMAIWWEAYQQDHFIPPDLKKMEDYFIYSDVISKSSTFWNFVGKVNIEMLVSLGFENFKRTVSSNYFTWIVDLDTYAANLLNRPREFMVPISQDELNKACYFLPVHQFFQLSEKFPDFIKITIQ